MTRPSKKNLDQILKEQRANEFDFEALIEPYREGGTQALPVRRTWGTVVRWLLDKHKFEPIVAGAAIMLVCLEMKSGKVFQGNGTYGSSGDQFVQYIRRLCLSLREKNQADNVFSIMGKKMFGQMEGMLAEQIKKQLKPWWRRLF